MEKQIKRRGTKRTFDEQLTLGENLLIWRRRLNWNQSQAAKHFKISIFFYKLAEYDKSRNDFKYPKFKHSLNPWEKCVLWRRRSGKGQKEIAAELHISRNWLNQMETGKIDCTRLLEWWSNG